MDEPAAITMPFPTAEPVEVALEFESFFTAERPRLFRALLLVTNNGHEAEELMQDAFCRVWERWDRVANMQDPTGYLFRTALNGYRSRYRRALRSAKRLISPTAAAEDPLEEVAARDEALQALAKLTPRQRAAVVLTELLGYTFEGAAEILRVRPGTVRAFVSQARARLTEISEVDDE